LNKNLFGKNLEEN